MGPLERLSQIWWDTDDWKSAGGNIPRHGEKWNTTCIKTSHRSVCGLALKTICVIDRRSGYVPNADALKAIAEVVKRLKSRDSELVYLLDRGLSLHRTNSCG